jgi:hypothetical protein
MLDVGTLKTYISYGHIGLISYFMVGVGIQSFERKNINIMGYYLLLIKQY